MIQDPQAKPFIGKSKVWHKDKKLLKKEYKMPIHKTDGKWQWGQHGKKYKSKAGAVKQMKAAFANGYKGK